MGSNERDELDNLLDRALSSYSVQEPRWGLEERLLNRIRAAGAARRFAWLRWAVAIPALACLLVLMFTFRVERDSNSNTPQEVRTAAIPLDAAPDTLRTNPEIPKPVRRSGAKRLPFPKREQFPAPAPITDEERALMTFVARAPDEAREVLIEARKRDAEPIQIEEIQIEPLQSGG